MIKHSTLFATMSDECFFTKHRLPFWEVSCYDIQACNLPHFPTASNPEQSPASDSTFTETTSYKLKHVIPAEAVLKLKLQYFGHLM